jgi:hypothetical protein
MGKSAIGSRKGGAPVKKKTDYLKRTIAGLLAVNPSAKIAVYTCNRSSFDTARQIHQQTILLDCPPLELPLASLRAFYAAATASCPDDNDIVVFNEDDQVLTIADSVLHDLYSWKGPVIFSPHRWSKLFLLFRIKHRPIAGVFGKRGVLDNYKPGPARRTVTGIHVYDIQENRFEAYSACWFARVSTFRQFNLETKKSELCLEQASYTAFNSGALVLKLSLASGEKPENFIADHLSGYDYNKRLLW